MVSAGADVSAASHFIDSIGDACLVLDEDLRIAVANPAATALYRASAPLLGVPFEELCTAGGRADALMHVSSCETAPVAFAAEQRRGDGSVFTAELTAAACADPAGVTLVVRERGSRPVPCNDELAVRNIALENSLDGIVVHTLDGVLLYANRAACAQWGVCDIDEIVKLGPFGWVPSDERPLVRARVLTLRTEGEARFEARGRTENGAEINVEVHARLIDTDKGLIVVSTARDITERIQTEEMVRYLAYHDMLTGLANRVRLGQELSHEVSIAERHGDVLGVIFLDLNDFKPVNDTYGHTIGDHVLREVADRLAGCVREGDLVARLGGDEFVIVLPRLSSADDLPRIAEKLGAVISEPIAVGAQEVSVSATLGTALHQAGEDADSLLIRADLAMYDAREKRIAGCGLSGETHHDTQTERPAGVEW